MKTFIAALLLTTAAAHAHTIQGTMVKTGKVETVTFVRGIEVKCQMSVDGPGLLAGLRGKAGDVRNLLKEDQFGNPAYKVMATIKLKSKDREFLPLNFEEKITFSNLHASGVSDSLYVTLIPEAPAPTPQRPNPVAPAPGTSARFNIDDAGNIRSLAVNSPVGPVSCTF